MLNTLFEKIYEAAPQSGSGQWTHSYKTFYIPFNKLFSHKAMRKRIPTDFQWCGANKRGLTDISKAITMANSPGFTLMKTLSKCLEVGLKKTKQMALNT